MILIILKLISLKTIFLPSMTLALVLVSYDYCNKLSKLSSLEQYQFVILHFGRSEVLKGLTVLKSRFWQSCIPSGGSRRESIFLPFPVSRGPWFPWLVAPYHLQSQQWLIKSFSHRINLHIHLYHYFRFHIHVISYDICLCLTYVT